MATRNTRIAQDAQSSAPTEPASTQPRRGDGINRVILLGRLSVDPDLRSTPSGNPVTSFRLATNASGRTDFHAVECWGRLAEACAQYLAKGRRVYLDGRLSTKSWTAADGGRRSRTVVVAENVRFLGDRGVQAESLA